MSQEDVLEILRELGGTASTDAIRERAREKFPTATLANYVWDRLTRLEKWGRVRRENRGTLWTIVEEKK